MHVVFRLDASRAIGLGHLSRCANLALALAERGVVSSFVVGGEGGAALARARLPPALDVVEIERSGGDDDLAATTRRAERVSARWLIVDQYRIGERYLRKVREAGVPLCVLDDLADRELEMADLVVNTTPAGALVDYPSALEPRLLRGDYVLLHPAFSASSWRPRAGEGPRRVLVSFGGTDARDHLPSALDALRSWAPHAEIRAVVGVPDAASQALRGGVTPLHGQAPAQMAEHMAWADLAIATPSTIAWELSAVGAPAILCRVVENQIPTARYFRRLGAFPVLEGVSGLAEALGWFASLSAEDLTSRARLYGSCCDGLGAARLSAVLTGREPPSMV